MNESSQRQDPIQHQVKLVEQLRDSEREYGNELQILVEYYAEPLAASNGILSAEEHATIFGEIRSIAEFSIKFLSVLERIVSNWEEYIPGKFGDELLDFIPYLQMHENYVNFEHTSMTLLSEIELSNGAFREFCQSTSTRCNNRDLRTLLRLPLTRPKSFQGCFNSLLRYMDSIVSSSPRQSFVSKTNVGLFSGDLVKFRGLSAAAEDTVSTIEERMEENVAMDELRLLESEIMDTIDLASPSRRLIKRGKLKKIARKKMQTYEFFLLTDMLLYCRFARSKKHRSHDSTDDGSGLQLKLHNKLPIDRAFFVKNRDDIEKFPNTAFSIHSSVKSFLVCADSENEKRQWIECIEHTLSRQLRNKRSIVGSSREMTVPLFLPDDYSDFCMECGTQFNDHMNVRKKHCNHCGRLTCSNCTKSRLPHLKKADLVVRVCNACYAKNKALFPDFPPLPPAVTPPPPDDGRAATYAPGLFTSADGHLGRPEPESNMAWDSTTGYTSIEGDDSNDDTIGNTPPPLSSAIAAQRPSDVESDALSPFIDSSGKDDDDDDADDDADDDDDDDDGPGGGLPLLTRRETDKARHSLMGHDVVPDEIQVPSGGGFAEGDEDEDDSSADETRMQSIVVTPSTRNQSDGFDSSDGDDPQSTSSAKFHMIRHLSGHIDDHALRALLKHRESDSDGEGIVPVMDEYQPVDLEELHVQRTRTFTETLAAGDSDDEARRLREKMREHRRQSSAKIERFLKARPLPQTLIGKGVLVAMPFLDHHVRMADKLEAKQALTQKLDRRLSQKFRPSVSELEARGILPLGSSAEERAERMKTIKKRASASLQEKLAFRPAPGDVVARGLVPRQYVANMLGVSTIGVNVAQSMLYGKRGGQSPVHLHPTVANDTVENQLHIARSHRKRLLKSISERKREIGEQYEFKLRDLQDGIAETRNKVNDLMRYNDQLQQRVEIQTRLFKSSSTSASDSSPRLAERLREQVRILELDHQQITDSKLIFLESSARQLNILRTGIRAYKAFSQPRDAP